MEARCFKGARSSDQISPKLKQSLCTVEKASDLNHGQDYSRVKTTMFLRRVAILATQSIPENSM